MTQQQGVQSGTTVSPVAGFQLTSFPKENIFPYNFIKYTNFDVFPMTKTDIVRQIFVTLWQPCCICIS